jgi:tripartite-type tricarboxylate transporter receptor subunit TctC
MPLFQLNMRLARGADKFACWTYEIVANTDQEQYRMRPVATSFQVLVMAMTSVTALAASPADSYPLKSVRVIVPFAAGGTTDIVTRVLSQRLTEIWGQQLLVDNRPGAGGNIGSEAVAKAPNDGYSILMATVATHGINASLYKRLPYDPVTDFTPITLVASTPSVLMLNLAVPANSVRELVELAKAKPGTLNYGSPGSGSSHHLAGELFDSMAGVKMVHVPYKGTAAALIDVIAGQIQLTFDTLPSAMPYVKTRKLKAIAVTSLRRAQSLADLPTVAEAGVPGYEVTSWYGALAPAGTPAELIRKLNGDFVRVIRTPDIAARLVEAGAEPVANTPEEFGAFIRSELKKWAKVVQQSGAKAD